MIPDFAVAIVAMIVSVPLAWSEYKRFREQARTPASGRS